MACKDESRSWERVVAARAARIVAIDAFDEADRNAKRRAERYADVLRQWLARQSCPETCVTRRDVSNPARDWVRGWPHPDGRRYVIEVSYKIFVALICEEPPPQPDDELPPPDDELPPVDDDGPGEKENKEDEAECSGPVPPVTVPAGTNLTPQSPFFRADGIGPEPTTTAVWATWNNRALKAAAADMARRLVHAQCSEGCRAEWDTDAELKLNTVNSLSQTGVIGLKYWYTLRETVTAVCVPE